jgi:hypothetical protein
VEYFNPEDGSSVFPGNSAISVYKTFTRPAKYLQGLSTRTQGMREEFSYATQQKTVFLIAIS